MMEWTTTPPTVDGFYWAKSRGHFTTVEVYGFDVGYALVGTILSEVGSEIGDVAAHGIAEWYGPLEPPA